jgi:hypothetical protein
MVGVILPHARGTRHAWMPAVGRSRIGGEPRLVTEHGLLAASPMQAAFPYGGSLLLSCGLGELLLIIQSTQELV